MKIRPIFAWYDLWVGAFYDRKNRRLYVMPVPMMGVVIEFGGLMDGRCEYCHRERCDDPGCKRFAEMEDHPDAEVRDA